MKPDLNLGVAGCLAILEVDFGIVEILYFFDAQFSEVRDGRHCFCIFKIKGSWIDLANMVGKFDCFLSSFSGGEKTPCIIVY